MRKINMSMIFWIGLLCSISLTVVCNTIFSFDRELSLIIGFIGIVFAGVLEVLNSLERLYEYRARELSFRKEAYRKVSELHMSLKNLYLQITEDSRNQIVKDLLVGKTEEFQEEIEKIRHGRINLIDYEVPMTAKKLAYEVQSTLCATCIWGENPMGDDENDYLYILDRAIEDKSVLIKRIFIITREELNLPEFKTRFKNEREKGITVRYLFKDQWSNYGLEKYPIDYAIWDKHYIWKYDNEVVRSKTAKLLWGDLLVKRYQDIYDTIWGKSYFFLPKNVESSDKSLHI